MKTFILSFALFLGVNFAHATIYRLGYTGLPVAGKDFAISDYASAENAASAGDTIQVYQQLSTTTTYFNVFKAVKIIGFGHSLDANSNLQVQNKPDSSFNNTVVAFYPGSAGASVQGLNISFAGIYESNITITRCRFKNGSYSSSSYGAYAPLNDCNGNPFQVTDGGNIDIYPAAAGYNLSNITINGCYFDNFDETPFWNGSDQNAIKLSGSTYSVSNLLITNNYFNSNVNLFNGSSYGIVNGVFANNVVNYKFRHQYSVGQMLSYSGIAQVCTEGFFDTYPQFTSSGKKSNFDYFLIKNNIFNTADTVTYPLNAQNCIVQNNIFSCASQYAGASAGGTGNIYKADMATVFGTTWNDGYVTNDYQLALGASSPALNAGLKGNNTATHCGTTGGEAGQEYRLSGIPAVPAVYLLTAPSINATTNPYNVTISVRSNN